MKLNTLFCLLITILFSGTLMGQVDVSDGYMGYKWGMPESSFLWKYTKDHQGVKLQAEKAGVWVSNYEMKEVKEGITINTTFKFYNGFLYQVQRKTFAAIKGAYSMKEYERNQEELPKKLEKQFRGSDVVTVEAFMRFPGVSGDRITHAGIGIVFTNTKVLEEQKKIVSAKEAAQTPDIYELLAKPLEP